MQDFASELHPPHTSAAAAQGSLAYVAPPVSCLFTCVLLVKLYPSKCDVVSHLKAFVHSLHFFWGAWTSDSLRQSLRLQLLCAPTLLDGKDSLHVVSMYITLQCIMWFAQAKTPSPSTAPEHAKASPLLVVPWLCISLSPFFIQSSGMIQ